MRRWLVFLLVLVLLGGFLAVAGFALYQRAGAGKGLPAYSVYSEESDGLAGAAVFVSRLGWRPVAVTRPAPIQDSARPRLLILAEPADAGVLAGFHDAVSDAEADLLLRWVSAGNTLLLAGRHNTAVHRALDALIDTDEGFEDKTHGVDVGDAGRYTADIDALVVEGDDALHSDRGLPLWYVNGRAAATIIRHGKGRVFVVADPSLLTRRGLRRADNCLFLYHVVAQHARDGRVYFDEFHHGFRTGGGFWDYLRFHQQHWALVGVFIVFAVAVWGMAVRLGPAVATPPATQADAVDYASAVARIYQRAGVRTPLAKSLTRSFFGGLTKFLRLRRSALPAEILAAWRQRHPRASADRLKELLSGAMELRKAAVPDRRLLGWTQAMDQFQQEMMKR
jgi:hypothetical protein